MEGLGDALQPCNLCRDSRSQASCAGLRVRNGRGATPSGRASLLPPSLQ